MVFEEHHAQRLPGREVQGFGLVRAGVRLAHVSTDRATVF